MRRSAIMVKELERRAGEEELRWRRFFRDPSAWTDNRATKRGSRKPDFENAATGEGLWLGTGICPHWVAARLGRLMGDEPKPRGSNAAVRFDQRLQPEDGGAPSLFTLLVALKECGTSKDLETGRKIHARAMESGAASSMFLENALVDMYVKCHSMADAHLVLDGMQQSCVLSWNAILMGYAYKGDAASVLEHFEEMQSRCCPPNRVTFHLALMACGKQACLSRGKLIHAKAAARGLETDALVASALVFMYTKCGSMVEALRTFESMPRPGVMAWNSLLMGHAAAAAAGAQDGQEQLGLELRAGMKCAPNAVTLVALAKACSGLLARGKLGKAEALVRATHIRDEAAKRGLLMDACLSRALETLFMQANR